MPKMTDRQAAAWISLVTEVRVHAPELPKSHWKWDFAWLDESRPGRGHDLSATVSDGEHFSQIQMDVYGSGSVFVALITTLHNSADEECGCEPCETDRKKDSENQTPLCPDCKHEMDRLDASVEFMCVLCWLRNPRRKIMLKMVRDE
jgi:hypothetical protein